MSPSEPEAPSGWEADELQDARVEARRMPTSWRAIATTLLIVSVVCAVLYRILAIGELKQTTALFIGLPFVLGLLTIHLTRARSVVGAVLRADIVFLLIVAPLLGEGSICLIMAAPLFIGVSLVAVTALGLERRSGVLGIAALPFLWGIADRHTSWLEPQVQTVRTTLAVEGTVEDWRDGVRTKTPIPAKVGGYLALGFPRPVRASSEGPERLIVEFEMNGSPGGSWQARRERTAKGVSFVLEEDTTKIGTWIRILDTRVDVERAPDGGTRLVQTTRFVPGLSPHAYFVPFERWALRCAHGLAIESFEAAAPDVR